MFSICCLVRTKFTLHYLALDVCFVDIVEFNVSNKVPAMGSCFYLYLFSLLVIAHSGSVGADIDVDLAAEFRYFPNEGLFGQTRFQPSLSGQAEYVESFTNNDVEFIVFGRVDKEDKERSHADVREAAWTHFGEEWEIKVGISKVFWGVAESAHFVDVINQNDALEGIDGEEKLGQPLTKLSFEKSWGTVDFFWMPYFRERSFVGPDGRLGLPLAVDVDNAQYESSQEQWHDDFAFRYSHYIGDFDFAVSHFSGTGREPILAFNNDFSAPKLLPIYEVVDQTGLELQYLFEEWIFKFEGITNSGMLRRYSAAVAGFEFTQVGVFESQADLGWLFEYLYDDRRNYPITLFERDVFAGWRYAFNDADSSEVLVGIIYDTKSHERMFSIEASQRIAEDITLNIEARVFSGATKLSDQLPDILDTLARPDIYGKSSYLQDEDYLQLEFVKYF